MNLKDKVILITGGSRGIGLEIALRAAKDGARVAICAKTVEATEKVHGTIFTAADAIRAAGGQAISIQCDVRFEDQVKNAVEKTVEAFGGIDIVVNNAGAIQLTGIEATDMKRFDLMQSINTRAVYMTAKYALPYLKKSSNAHILSLSPPLNLDPAWVGPQLAYTLSKYGMSLCTMGLSAELKPFGIAVNSLWPETAIDTAAIRNLLGEGAAKVSRTAAIVADAAYWVFTQSAVSCSGNFFIDSKVLNDAGVTDLSKYAVDPTSVLLPDFFLGSPTADMMAKIKAAHAPAPVTVPATGPTSVTVGATDAAGDSGSVGKAVGAGDKAGGIDEQAVGTGDKTDGTVSVVAVASKPAYSAFTVGHAGKVATLTLSNPGRSNALGQAFWTEFPQALQALAADGKTAALVICGDGANFCSGIDVSLFGNKALADTKSETGKVVVRALIDSMQEAFNAIERAPFPVIAAVHGVCMGAGLDLIAACDFRYASALATFSIAEINLGIIADLGSLQRLPLSMPEGLVREMAFTGMSIAADRALSSGLVNAVYPRKEELMTFVMKTAETIADKHGAAVKASKASLNFNRDAAIAAGLDKAAQLQIEVIDPAVIRANFAKQKK